MSDDLTEMAIAALVASPIITVASHVAPEYAWAFGVMLMAWGILSDVRAYLDNHDLKGYVIGTVTLIFGIATEFASLDDLVKMTIFAVLWGAFWLIVETISRRLGL